jgi:hypothetical protein
LSLIDIEAFYKKRDYLIDALEAGDLDKAAYFEESMAYLKEINFKPQPVDTLDFDSAVIHYQYFNLMAKMNFVEQEAKTFNQPEQAQKHHDTGFDFYTKKDQVSMRLLELVNYKGLKAYYITMQSKSLEGKLFEILFEDESRIVLHSRDKRILYRLTTAGVFDDQIQPSIIHDYVNTRYK